MQNNWNTIYESGKSYRLMNDLLLEKILAQANLDADAIVLDIGCGTGHLALKLAQRGFLVTGIDLSEVAIEKALQSKKEKTTFKVLDIESPTALDNLERYDLITCKLVYAFIKDRTAFLSRVTGLLKPGGVFALITPVLQPDIRNYSPRMLNISVDRVETEKLLKEAFTDFAVINQDYFDENGLEVTYLCSNNSAIK